MDETQRRTRHTHEITDPVFGELILSFDRDRGRVEVQGEALPHVTVERTGEPTQSHVPIGTRSADALTLRLDGRVQDLRPGPGRLSRRSYRVAARVDDQDLLLAPRSPTSSRWVRGSSVRSGDELGSFERVAGGVVVVEWADEVTVLGSTVAAPEPSPAEAAIGYALAAAFGTGARFLLAALIEGAGHAEPF